MKTKIYEPNQYNKIGIRVWALMFKDLNESKELIVQFFMRNLASKYKQSILGYLWAIINPFVIIGSFVFLQRAGILNIPSTNIPYPLFALIGLSVWQLFATGINTGCRSLIDSGSLLSKIKFPQEALIFSSLAHALFEFIIKFILIVFFFIYYQVTPSWAIFIFPFALIPLILLTLGLSFILSLINAILRDVANIIVLLTTFLMFLTPVMYLPSSKNAFLFKLNPLSALINAPRELIIYGAIQSPEDFIISSVLALLIFLTSWRIFNLVQTKIPERI